VRYLTGVMRKVIFAHSEKGKPMDELLQNIQDFTDEIASTIRLAIWVQIMNGETLEDENDTD